MLDYCLFMISNSLTKVISVTKQDMDYHIINVHTNSINTVCKHNCYDISIEHWQKQTNLFICKHNDSFYVQARVEILFVQSHSNWNRIFTTALQDICPPDLEIQSLNGFAFQGTSTLSNLTSQKQTLDGNLQSQDKITQSSRSFLTKTL